MNYNEENEIETIELLKLFYDNPEWIKLINDYNEKINGFWLKLIDDDLAKEFEQLVITFNELYTLEGIIGYQMGHEEIVKKIKKLLKD